MCVIAQISPGVSRMIEIARVGRGQECQSNSRLANWRWEIEMGRYQKDSPFLIVEHGLDGLWRVHGWTIDTSGVLFNERQEACDYAAERARTKKDSMVLLREQQDRRKRSRS